MITTKKDEWILDIVPIEESYYSCVTLCDEPNYSLRGEPDYRLMYKRKTGSVLYPDKICLHSFFNPLSSNIPRTLFNYKVLFDGKIPPLSLEIYFTSIKPKSSDVSFINFVFDSDHDYILEPNYCHVYSVLNNKQKSLDAELVWTIFGNNYLSSHTILVSNQEIVSYVINSLKRVCNSYCGELYMVLKKGNLFTEKEKKQKIFLFNELGLFNRKLMF